MRRRHAEVRGLFGSALIWCVQGYFESHLIIAIGLRWVEQGIDKSQRIERALSVISTYPYNKECFTLREVSKVVINLAVRHTHTHTL